MSACDWCEVLLGTDAAPCECSEGYCDRCSRCDVHCVCAELEPEFFPGEPVIVTTTAGELPGVVDGALDDGVYRVQVEGVFPVMLRLARAMRPGADEPVVVEG